jgi:hypothetical protein
VPFAPARAVIHAERVAAIWEKLNGGLMHALDDAHRSPCWSASAACPHPCVGEDMGRSTTDRSRNRGQPDLGAALEGRDGAQRVGLGVAALALPRRGAAERWNSRSG